MSNNQQCCSKNIFTIFCVIFKLVSCLHYSHITFLMPRLAEYREKCKFMKECWIVPAVKITAR